MQDTLVPVSHTALTGELQTAGFTKKLLLPMTELRNTGSLVRRWGSTAQPPRSCAGCFSLKVGIDYGNHAKNVPRGHIWSKFYNLWSHDFYDDNVDILIRSWCQNFWNSHDSWNRAIGLSWGCYLGFGAISLVFVSIAALSLLRVVVGLLFLLLAAGRAFTFATSLLGTASFIYDLFNFFLDGGSEIRKELTLGREGPVELLKDAVEVSGCWPWRFK